VVISRHLQPATSADYLQTAGLCKVSVSQNCQNKLKIDPHTPGAGLKYHTVW